MVSFLELVAAAIILWVGGIGLIVYVPPLWWVGAILLFFAVVVTLYLLFGWKP